VFILLRKLYCELLKESFGICCCGAGIELGALGSARVCCSFCGDGEPEGHWAGDMGHGACGRGGDSAQLGCV
jgi:hypothetical protein